MGNTIQLTFAVEDEAVKDRLVAELSEFEFSGFEEKEGQLLAFIDESVYDETVIDSIAKQYSLTFSKEIIEEQNWNAVWESNFHPVIVDDFCVVRADFHPPVASVQYDIIITPKMSFGTGHHATTYMMMKEMSRLDFAKKRVADFGTGTGVLAILAEKMGAEYVAAIDYDDWSIENSRENVERNNCSKIAISKADYYNADGAYDIILANINKNVILDNIENLSKGLKDGGKLLLSGLLDTDETDILAACRAQGLKHLGTVEKNKWICILLESGSLSD